MNILASNWRPVDGWPYEVSDQGEVRRQGSGKALKPWISLGYEYVGLWKDGEQLRIAVHTLVARAFLPPPGEGQTQVAHNDGDPAHNLPSNLRWATPRENAADRHAHGTGAAGEDNPRAVLTEAAVAEIRQLRAGGLLQREVAEIFGVCRQTVSDIELGRRWRIAA